ncbi:ABC transporter permease [Niameybacter massiliensis]|uniref:ABC transporter permease n=1 Tax=Niameybacter massiliensis TaxID=1658108 RepID=UPI0006B4B316|nr:ABC transporter permease [Niameybacter massiliensis]
MRTFLQNLLKEIDYTSKKLGLLILFFIGMPFLGMWFTGAYYSEYVNDVPIAVLDEDNSSLSRQIIEYFDQNERYNVDYYASSREELEQLINERKVYMGLYIPPDLNNNIKLGNQSQVLVLTDGTNVIIGNNVYAGAAQIVQMVSGGAAIQVLQAKGSLEAKMAMNVAVPFGFEERMLYDSKLTYMNYLIYGIIAVFLQQLMLSSMATLLSRNPEEVATKDTFTQVAAKMTVGAVCLIASGSFTIFLLHKKFHLIFNGNVMVALILSFLFAVAISGPTLILFSLTKKKTRFTQIAYMLSLPTFLTCGYVWPVDQMPLLLAIPVKILWPLMNYARAFDEVMIKGLPFATVSQNVVELLVYSLIMLPIGIKCFKKSFYKNEKREETVQIVNEENLNL